MLHQNERLQLLCVRQHRKMHSHAKDTYKNSGQLNSSHVPLKDEHDNGDHCGVRSTIVKGRKEKGEEGEGKGEGKKDWKGKKHPPVSKALNLLIRKDKPSSHMFLCRSLQQLFVYTGFGLWTFSKCVSVVWAHASTRQFYVHVLISGRKRGTNIDMKTCYA